MITHNLLLTSFLLLFFGLIDAKAVPVVDIRYGVPKPPAYCENVDRLISVLYEKRLQSFCRQFIDYKYGFSIRVTKTVTATTCANGNLGCKPTTITPVVVQTATLTNTISVESQPTTETSFVTPPITTIENTVTRTATATTTYTIGSPQNQVLSKRGYQPKIPSCISNCGARKISSACSSLVVPTTTIKKTVTIAGTIKTVTANPRTSSVTITKLITTLIPGKTITEISTILPQSETVTTTVDTTVTTTVSLCPSRTPNVFAIGMVYTGSNTGDYVFPGAASEEECCGACYADAGCFGWLWNSQCTYVKSIEQSQGNGQCPTSLTLLLPLGDTGVGGRGPCFRE
ncbi:hypothetical protein TWF694_001485 [Orbilia ellipsospora]|uniref:Apple domain-containing protein n=1 Tax=Orbilia ellipsospora TaxID=2528407 RepID=A0AAV9XYA1_9PEZI